MVHAYLSIEHATCPGCGGDLEETTRHDPRAGYDIDHHPCKRCQALDTVRTAYHEAHKDKQGRSDVHQHIWTATPIRRPD